MASTRVTGTATVSNASIGTSAAVIVDGSPGRTSLTVQNAHAANVLYVGYSSSVTTSNGLRLNPGESAYFEDYLGPVYGIASAAATDVRYWETGT